MYYSSRWPAVRVLRAAAAGCGVPTVQVADRADGVHVLCSPIALPDPRPHWPRVARVELQGAHRDATRDSGRGCHGSVRQPVERRSHTLPAAALVLLPVPDPPAPDRPHQHNEC